MTDLFNDGVYYEPRAYWAARYFAESDTRTHTTFQRRFLRNGSRYPVTLERMAICAINQPLTRISGTAALLPDGAGSCVAPVFYDARIRVSVPFRKSFSRYTMLTSGLTPKPTSMIDSITGEESSLFGQTLLRFDKPLILPRNGSIEWDLSALGGMRWPANGEAAVAFDLAYDPINVTQVFFEQGGLFSGSARIKQSTIVTTNQAATPQDTDDIFPYPRPAPWIAPPAGPGNAPWWNPTSRFSARDFDHQESTRAGSTHIYAMSTQIDQIDYDDAAIAAFNLGEYPAVTMSPLSTRVGSRVRMTGGLTGDWWWYPGAPLALVLDTVTPALVYDLVAPITLQPGDAFEVELELPAIPNSMNIGISFNGWAAITG